MELGLNARSLILRPELFTPEPYGFEMCCQHVCLWVGGPEYILFSFSFLNLRKRERGQGQGWRKREKPQSVVPPIHASVG